MCSESPVILRPAAHLLCSRLMTYKALLHFLYVLTLTHCNGLPLANTLPLPVSPLFTLFLVISLLSVTFPFPCQRRLVIVGLVHSQDVLN